MLSGLRAVVSSDGEHGENLIREDEAGFTVALRRPVRDLRKQLPNIEVRSLRRQQWSGTTRARQRELVALCSGLRFVPHPLNVSNCPSSYEGDREQDLTGDATA